MFNLELEIALGLGVSVDLLVELPCLNNGLVVAQVEPVILLYLILLVIFA